MKEKLLEVQKKLYENLKDTYKIWGNNVLFDIVNDDFVIKEDKDWGDYLYLKIDRKTFEVINIKAGKDISLKEINQLCEDVITIIKEFEEDFNKLFGVKLNTIEDFKENIKMLLDSAIDRKYVLGKTTKKKNWEGKEYEYNYK